MTERQEQMRSDLISLWTIEDAQHAYQELDKANQRLKVAFYATGKGSKAEWEAARAAWRQAFDNATNHDLHLLFQPWRYSEAADLAAEALG